MKHINLFETVTQYNAVSSKLAKPQVAYVEENHGLVFLPGSVIPEDFVDLGLPSGRLWCKHNLGATCQDTPTSWYGDYYAWGETETKSYYDWEDPNDATQNYKHAKGSYDTLTKYCNDSNYGYEGYTDELTQLVPSDDVATKNNSAQRMPTQAELEELLQCVNEWKNDYNGIEGLNGRVFYKSNFAFKSPGITLYVPFNSEMTPTPGVLNPIDDETWAYLARFTKDELDVMISAATDRAITDVTEVMYKDDTSSTPAIYGTDYGFKSISDKNTFIFIPAAGYKYRSSLFNDVSYCYLWSSSLYADNPGNAWNLGCDSDGVSVSDGDRYGGRSVRSVL